MARMNISLPDEMKDEMDELQMNWSQVAQEAFARALQHERRKVSEGELAAGLLRLRVSKASSIESGKEIGFTEGMKWALEDASFAALRMVAGIGRTEAHELPVNVELESQVQMALELSPGSFERPSWDFGETTEQFATGFIEGARKVFDQI